MMLFKTISLLVFSIFTFSLTHAQTLNGKVLDRNGQGIENVYIYIKGEENHTHSNAVGTFFIDGIKNGDTLITNHLSYSSEIFIVSNKNETVQIRLNDRQIDIREVTINPGLNSVSVLSEISLKTNPVKSSQELMRRVPGLFIGQHAGGGKAEQIFLRGFDIDHGTDLAITIDGMPINQVSHAHGQGYADLHFIIPETIDKIGLAKGPYETAHGNFATAGFVGFESKDRLEGNLIKIEAGMFNTQRFLGMFDVLNKEKESLYFGIEQLQTDGYFESSQNFNRINLFTKYNKRLIDGSEFSISFAHFTSQWDASGQIPIRKVKDGTISRFGAIDDTEGGETARSNIQFAHTKIIDEQSFVRTKAYFSNYEFELFSNFTFFLSDSNNGDQIRQFENRQTLGFNSEYIRYFDFLEDKSSFRFGLGLRNDKVKDNLLSKTINRKVGIDTSAFGNVNESNSFLYTNMNLNFGRLQVISGLRVDFFKFGYYDRLLTQYNNNIESESIISPKLNLIYNFNDHLQFYLKSGQGFHTNDSRLINSNLSGITLPKAYGSDLGIIAKPNQRLLLNAAIWYLYIEDELVYVGDEAIVEPSGETKRQGIDLSFRYQPFSFLNFNLDISYVEAKLINAEGRNNKIPLAPDFTLQFGADLQIESGLFSGIQLRYMDDRPANEDNSIVAEGYLLIDANIGYKLKDFTINAIVENVLDTEWNETQFVTESRLSNESRSSEEIHFTPGTPFNARVALSYRF